jgi:peptidoglycan/LPS O-acetylase OafA/YrhL
MTASPNAVADSSAQSSVPGRLQKGGNNFDFLRLSLAAMVVVSHSIPALEGNDTNEPLARLTPEHLTLGFFAVNGFFIISGLLVLQSYERSRGLLDYFKRRALRIYPAFIVVSLLCILVVGALGSADASAYLGNVLSWDYFTFALKRLCFLYTPVTPSVFDGLALPMVNSSIWTVHYEFGCYIALAVLGLLGVFKRRGLVLLLTAAFYVLNIFQQAGQHGAGGQGLSLLKSLNVWPRFATYFGAGMCCYLYRDKISYQRTAALFSALIVCAGCLLLGASAITLPVFGTYLLFALAFSDALPFHNFGKSGDYSYGMFLYAWPVQILCVWYAHGQITPLPLAACGLLGALLLAIFSWHLVEKPFLSLKKS